MCCCSSWCHLQHPVDNDQWWSIMINDDQLWSMMINDDQWWSMMINDDWIHTWSLLLTLRTAPLFFRRSESMFSLLTVRMLLPLLISSTLRAWSESLTSLRVVLTESRDSKLFSCSAVDTKFKCSYISKLLKTPENVIFHLGWEDEICLKWCWMIWLHMILIVQLE